MVKAVVVAGTHSGVGKTSIAVGLMAALQARGLVVAPFKVGPDFLDGLHHTAATGRPSINLDGFMLTRDQALASFSRAAAGADVAVVEGVMGLFDSRDGRSEDGSTAQIAKWLGAPVLLVLDCWAMARSAAAVVKGFSEFDPDLNLAGVIFNKVGGAAHAAWLEEALTAAGLAARVLGGVPKDPAVSIPERHLGLTTPAEQRPQHAAAGGGGDAPSRGDAGGADRGYIGQLRRLVGDNLDLEAVLQLDSEIRVVPAAADVALAVGRPAGEGRAGGGRAGLPRPRIGVALDEAFLFYYRDNLLLLEAAGAELVTFSPLRDAALPPRLSGLYLGGGYPERFAAGLAANAAMRAQVAAFSGAGGVVYAECGGLMYLSASLEPGPGAAEGAGAGTVGGRGGDEVGASGSPSAGKGQEEGKQQQQQQRQQQQQQPAAYPMVGVFPFRTRMAAARGMRMGYCEVLPLPGCPLFSVGGAAVRAQMFHFSEIVEDHQEHSNGDADSNPGGGGACGGGGAAAACRGGGGGSGGGSRCAYTRTYRLQMVAPGAAPEAEGYSVRRTLASYVHIHFGGCPQLAASLVDKCREVDVTYVSAAVARASGAAAREDSRAALGGAGRDDCPYCSRPHGQSEAGAAGEKPSETAAAAPAAAMAPQGPQHPEPRPPDRAVPGRIVSLLPSGTEICLALGLGPPHLAAVSAFCDDVSSGGCSGDSSGINCGSGAGLVSAARAVGASPVAHLPRAVRSLVDTSAMTSRKVDEVMQRLKAQGRPPFEIDVALLRRLRPALVLSQDACAACDATAAQACAALRSAGIGAGGCRVLSLSPRTLAEVAECIVSVGEAAGAGGEARALVADLRRRQAAVASVAAAALEADKRAAAAESGGGSGGSAVRPGRPWQRRPRVLLLCGLDPFVLGGQWIPDLITTVCGAEDASGQLPGDPPLRVTWDDVMRFAPDLLVLSPCSRSPGNALGEALALSTRPGWWGLPAVASREVYIADHGLFSRPGPGMATRGAEVLARLVWGPGAEGLGPCPQGAVLKMRPPEGVEEGPAAMERDWFVDWD